MRRNELEELLYKAVADALGVTIETTQDTADTAPVLLLPPRLAQRRRRAAEAPRHAAA